MEQIDVFPKMRDLVKEIICARLEVFNGNRSMASKSLGMSRTTFYREMKRLNIKVQQNVTAS